MVHPAHAEAVALFLSAQREWISNDSGYLERFDMVAASATWTAMGWPVGSPRLAGAIRSVQQIADAALAEANKLIGLRIERLRSKSRGR